MVRDGGERSTEVVLRLMDHQLVGPSGALIGNVDNLVLRADAGELTVVGMLVGPAGFGPRQPGMLGRWIMAVWRRLHRREDPRALMVPMSHVRSIRSAVTVSDHAEQVLQENSGLEHWLRRHVISRIPGASAGEDRLSGTAIRPPSRHEELDRPQDTHLLSDLLGAEVVDEAGAALGTLMELRATPFEQSGLEVGRLRVTRLVFGRRRLGGELGYTTLTDQGPWLLARLLGWWHRDDREAAWTDVLDVDWRRRRIVLKTAAERRHPHRSQNSGVG
jgi:sporulation protein YlmC with PRC-barrel domain